MLTIKRMYDIISLALDEANKNGLVVQLVRMPHCHCGGRGFESRPDRQEKEFRVNIRDSFLFPFF